MKVIVASVEEPITVAEARSHLEAAAYEDSDIDPIDDTMIEGWVSAAREWCENYTGLSLATKTVEIALDSFPTVAIDGSTAINLPFGPVREIVSIFVPADEYTSDDVDSDSTADEAVWADGQVNPDQYVLDDYSVPNKVKPVTSWPSITTETNGIKVRYLTGYGTDSDATNSLPKSIRAAILLVLGHLYKNRENSTEVAMFTIPLGAESLLQFYRVRLGMA